MLRKSLSYAPRLQHFTALESYMPIRHLLAANMSENDFKSRLSESIDAYDNFPKDNVVFRDIFSLTRNISLFAELIDHLTEYIRQNCSDAEAIVGLDARGFLFGPSISIHLNLPFIPIRKAGKLPGEVHSKDYSLEYGSNNVEIQKHSLNGMKKVVVIDDLLATGGTMAAAVDLLQQSNVSVVKCIAVIELLQLEGRKLLKDTPFYSVVQY